MLLYQFMVLKVEIHKMQMLVELVVVELVALEEMLGLVVSQALVELE